ncbi:hypothetical protein NDU88_001801 [Pleurodeles waltl]|uniref:Uncharacterized protein n=1 Tax=Pleurodeles waltl TaxID=8319 RepID=A0AAV7SCL5_PLEWA|nr:hypothetical protein NDU88_001801 [Pleurodeles waltl]
MEDVCPAEELSHVLKTIIPEGEVVGMETNLILLSTPLTPEEVGPDFAEDPVGDNKEQSKKLVTQGLIRRLPEVLSACV